MPKTLSEIAEIAESEGLEYSIMEGYIKEDDFEDPSLHRAVLEVKTNLRMIESALESVMP